MPTYLEYKTVAANVLGRLDSASDQSLRDNWVNNAVRYRIASAFPFSFLRKTVSIAFTGNVATLPSDYIFTHGIYALKNPSGALFGEYDRMSNRSLTESTNSYEISDDGTDYLVTVSGDSDLTFTLTYYALPEVMTENTDRGVIPDAMCVGYLAAADYWMSRLDETNHDRYLQKGLTLLNQMIANDQRRSPRLNRGSVWNRDLGYNGGSSSIFG